MKAVILQSKMNSDYCKYGMARKFIESLPLDQWVYIKDLPEHISFEIIDLIDSHKAAYKTVFCETFEKFIVTRCIPEIAILNLNKYFTFDQQAEKKTILSKYTGVRYDKKTKKFRSEIKIKNRSIYLGSFKNEKYASIAFQIAKINLRNN